MRDYWRAREARRAVEWPRLVDDAVRTKNTQKLSDYTFFEEERSFAAAKRLYDDLIWYMAANNRISGDGSGATDTPEAPFKPVLRKRFAGEHLTEFGGVRLKTDVGAFLKSGFAFGDTVDIRFSNGAAISGLPVYDGYYAKVDERLVVCQNDEIRIQRKFGADLFKEQGLQEPFDVEITLHQAGGRLAVQTALALTYSDERGDYASDAVFANFRALSGGEVAANLFYRGASPCDNLHKRALTVTLLAEAAGIDCFVDLADTPEKIQAYWNDENVYAPYWKGCVRDGKVHSHAIGANFRADSYRSGIVAALRTIKNHDFGGRCYIHSQEGKDRTGFLCVLIESLGGATLEEIERDYMQSFVNYYGLDKTRDADRYQMVRDIYFGGIVAYLANRPLDEVTKISSSGLRTISITAAWRKRKSPRLRPGSRESRSGKPGFMILKSPNYRTKRHQLTEQNCNN